MIQHHECVLIMGRRGCGKSHLARKIQTIWPRRVIIDTLNEYSEQDFPNAETVFTFHDFSEKLKQYKTENRQAFVLIFQFDIESTMNDQEFDHILRLCYYFGNMQIVIEEVQNFATPHLLPHWLKQCLFTGRHQHISLLFTTQRPAMLNKNILSQCAHVFCGQLIETNDIIYVSGFFKKDGQKLTSMAERRFLYHSPKGITEISNDF